MNESEQLEELYTMMAELFAKQGDERKIIRGRTSYTGVQLAEEIRQRTEVGREYVKMMLRLAVDLTMRDKSFASKS